MTLSKLMYCIIHYTVQAVICIISWYNLTLPRYFERSIRYCIILILILRKLMLVHATESYISTTVIFLGCLLFIYGPEQCYVPWYQHFYNVCTSEVDAVHVRHDATFIGLMGFRPTVSSRFPEAIAIRYRTLTIGRVSTKYIELDKLDIVILPAQKLLLFSLTRQKFLSKLNKMISAKINN